MGEGRAEVDLEAEGIKEEEGREEEEGEEEGKGAVMGAEEERRGGKTGLEGGEGWWR